MALFLVCIIITFLREAEIIRKPNHTELGKKGFPGSKALEEEHQDGRKQWIDHNTSIRNQQNYFSDISLSKQLRLVGSKFTLRELCYLGENVNFSNSQTKPLISMKTFLICRY